MMFVLLALLLPALLGTAAWISLAGRPVGFAGGCAALGSGYFAGALGWGALLGVFGGGDAATLFARLAPWLGVVAGVALVLAWRYAAPMPALAANAPASRNERIAIAIALVLLALAALTIVPQAVRLPSLSWDAWNAWLAKSKAWYFAGAMQPAVSFEAWRDAAHGGVITTTAHYYPEALPRLSLWLASAYGRWDDGAAHLAWPFAWIALGLACFGHLRRAGVRMALAVLATAGLLLMPLVTAHATLAGYSDLWLAATVMLAGLHFAAWRRDGRRADAALAVGFALLGVAAKLEGAVWLACFVAALVLALLPPRWRWSLLLAGPLVWLAALPFGGLRLPLPGLGVVRFDWGLVEIPARGTMTLAWRPVLDEFAQALFLLPNWSLLWYLAPLVLLLRRHHLGRRDLGALGGFLALGYAFLFVLFFLTDASAWAENFTSLNRVLLHVVPLTVAWLTLLWAAAPRDRSPASAA